MPEDFSNGHRKKRVLKEAKPKHIGPWHIGRTIGKGSSGHVRLARHTRTGDFAAVKIVSRQALVSSRRSMTNLPEETEKIMAAIEREIVVMKLIDHPNVLKLYDVWETKNEIYLVMEYVPGGELFDYLVERGRLPLPEAVHYFQQIINAVDYCHRFNVAHRDLKPENLLLDRGKNIKVADFGMAAWEGSDDLLTTSCGSPHYASPEVVAGEHYHGSISDIWSCGVILFALLAGRLPFDDDNVRVLLDKVRDGRFTMPNDITPAGRDLLRRMLEKDVARRITMEEILRHPFYNLYPVRPMDAELPPYPSLDIIKRPPVASAEEIDQDILRNLQTLWHGAPKEDILAGLLSEEPTWEKMAYHLLLRYREKQLKMIEVEESDEQKQQKRTVRKKKSTTDLTSNEPEKIVSAVENRRPNIQHRPLPSTPREEELHPRPDPPTPRRSAAHAPVDDRSPISTAFQDSDIRSRPTSVVTSSDYGDVVTTAGAPRHSTAPTVPSISLQGATPTRPVTHGRRVSAASSRSDGTSSTSASARSSLPYQLPPLRVPQFGNEEVQEFFADVADKLNLVQVLLQQQNASLESPELQAMALSLLDAVNPNGQMPYRSNVPAAPPPPTPLDQAFPLLPNDSRFEDAPEDSDSVQHKQQSDYYAEGRGRTPDPRLGQQGLGFSELDDTSVTPRPARTSVRHGNGPYQPAPARLVDVQHPRSASPMYPHPNGPRTRSHSRADGDMSDKENTPRPPRVMANHGLHQPRPTVRPRANSHGGESLKHRNSVVFDGPRRTPMGEKHVQIVEPQKDLARLRKRRSMYEEDTAYHSDSGVAAFDHGIYPMFPSVPQSIAKDRDQKRSWFSSLFNFNKGASYSLLSVYDPRTTREECRKHLQNVGLSVVVQNSESASGGVLKCKSDDLIDPAGAMAVVKAVRFRVEFHHTNASHSIAGYVTSLALVHEKGSLTTLKLIFNRLRRDWDLDVPGGLGTNRPSNRNSYHGGPNLRIVTTSTGSSGRSSTTLSPLSPALSSGGHFVEPDYYTPSY